MFSNSDWKVYKKSYRIQHKILTHNCLTILTIMGWFLREISRHFIMLELHWLRWQPMTQDTLEKMPRSLLTVWKSLCTGKIILLLPQKWKYAFYSSNRFVLTIRSYCKQFTKEPSEFLPFSGSKYNLQKRTMYLEKTSNDVSSLNLHWFQKDIVVNRMFLVSYTYILPRAYKLAGYSHS